MREIFVDCDSCGVRMPMQRAKEALISEGNNKFHLLDLCSTCLDEKMKGAKAVNDSDGFRQRAAVLITPA